MFTQLRHCISAVLVMRINDLLHNYLYFFNYGFDSILNESPNINDVSIYCCETYERRHHIKCHVTDIAMLSVALEKV